MDETEHQDDEECGCIQCHAERSAGRGRPPHEPTAENRKVVETLSGYGAQQWYIAGEIDVCERTLRKYYRSELDRGLEKANITVTQSLFKKAIGYTAETQKVLKSADGSERVEKLKVHFAADTGAMIWWDKTRNKQAETVKHEHTGRDGEPIRSITETMSAKEAEAEYARTLDDDEG